MDHSAETVSDEILGTSDEHRNNHSPSAGIPCFRSAFGSMNHCSPQGILIKKKQEKLGSSSQRDRRSFGWHGNAVEGFSDSDKESSTTTIDRASGQIQFGDGKNGMSPQPNASIKATYRTGGGAAGNVAAGEISNLLTSIAFCRQSHQPRISPRRQPTPRLKRACWKKAPKNSTSPSGRYEGRLWMAGKRGFESSSLCQMHSELERRRRKSAWMRLGYYSSWEQGRSSPSLSWTHKDGKKNTLRTNPISVQKSQWPSPPTLAFQSLQICTFPQLNWHPVWSSQL